jgi:hypothetical protein
VWWGKIENGEGRASTRSLYVPSIAISSEERQISLMTMMIDSFGFQLTSHALFLIKQDSSKRYLIVTE